MFEANVMTLVATMLGALAVAAIVFVISYPYISGDRQKDTRFRGVTETRTGRAALQAAGEAAANRRKAVSDSLKELEARQKAAAKVSLRLRLQQAGLHISTKVYWLGSTLCGLIFALIITMTLPPSGSRQLLAIAAGLVGTFGVPRWVLNKMTVRRQAKFIGELANAIDLVVRGVKSGLPLNECLATIARESPDPLGSEFREVGDQPRVGVSLSEARERLTTRMPLAEIRFLTLVIAIQQQAGGNLSEALGNLADVLRERFRLRMKVKALSAEAKASAVVLASLPPVVMFMVYGAAPDYIMPLFATRSGNLMLVFSGVWMLIGVLVMRRMINFKF
jgi:tight adherence protein B